MNRNLLVSLLLALLILPNLSFSGDYAGAVGGLAARFSLTWHDDGNVTGTYYYPSRPGVTYRLSGDNHTEGKLYLEEYTEKKLTAQMYLRKVLTDNAIVWRGEMNNTDGRTFDMQFSRARDEQPAQTKAPAPKPAGNRYTGNVGKLKAVYHLRWGNDGSVNGSYSYPARPGVVYRLEGSNHAEGKLYLEEMTDNRLTARCYLSKRVSEGNIIWEGNMENTDGRSFPMTLMRSRD